MNKKSIPLTVPKKQHKNYTENFENITKKSGRLFLFAADQKIEHLNQDFYGENLPAECNNPKHLFEIAQNAPIGAFATNLGLIAHYAADYKNINYIVKLNGKTNLVSTEQQDPESNLLYTIDDIVSFKEETGLSISGVGYTLYIGSEFESDMLTQAAQVILDAHHHGLLAILWIYPRGKAITNPTDANIVAGAAGVGAALGADFVKIISPQSEHISEQSELLKQTTQAAGKTKVICAGGKKENSAELLKRIYHNIHTGHTSGCAIGRNIFQNNLENAIGLCKAIASIVIENKNLEHAKNILHKK